VSARFITIEGGEGAGKSTQVRRLAEALRARGHRVVETREPGGSPGAEVIRGLLVSGASDRWDAWTEALLVTAARRDHVVRTIRPALDGGAWVISDRFFDSTLAYQGIAKGAGEAETRALQRLALGDFAPDLTLVLDLPAETGLARALARASAQGEAVSRFEALDLAFHHRLRAAFRAIAAAEPARCAVIDATAAVDDVAAAVWATVARRLAGDA